MSSLENESCKINRNALCRVGSKGKKYCTLFDDFRWKKLGMRTLTLECHIGKDKSWVFST